MKQENQQWRQRGFSRLLLPPQGHGKCFQSTQKCQITQFCAGSALTQVQASREFQVGALPVGVDCRHSELVVSLFWQVADGELGAGHVGLVAPDPGEAAEFLALHDVSVHGNGPLHPRRGPAQRH